jgi:hypothetical protein
MNEVSYVLDGVKYNKYHQAIAIQKTDRSEIKRLDKVYFRLIKFLNEDITVKIITMIKDSGYLSVLLFCLRIEDIKTAYVLAMVAKEFDYYKKIVQNNISTIVMSSLHSPLSLKIALELEVDLYPIPECGRLSDEMIICLYRHSMVFPQNRDICMSCIRSYNFKDSIFIRPFFFFGDEVEIVSKYFIKDPEVKNVVFKNVIDNGSINIMRKALSYYKEDPKIMMKMSLPILLKNTKIFSIYEMKTVVVSEACVYNRWELLPFIFENYKLDASIWDTIKFVIYRGMLNKTFVLALFNSMKKKGIEIDILHHKDKILKCSSDVKEVFEIFDTKKLFTLEIKESQPQFIDSSVASIFEYYLVDNLDYVKIQLFVLYAHKNKRFIEEKDYMLELITSGKIEWNDDLKKKFYQFNEMCNNFCCNLELIDMLIIEYNSYLSVSDFITHMMRMRFVNKIKKIVSSITENFLLDECQTILQRVEDEYWRVMSLVRKDIDLEELEDGEHWILPDDPTLEDLFKHLYQYSSFKNTGYDNAIKLTEALKKIGYHKIAKEVELCIVALISIDDILDILKRKNILFDVKSGTINVL